MPLPHAREAGLALPPGLDWFFGPFATQRARTVVEAWLTFAATDWTAQIMPFVELAANGPTIVISEIGYEHPAAQKADEEGDGKCVRKRLAQLNAILPIYKVAHPYPLRDNCVTLELISAVGRGFWGQAKTRVMGRFRGAGC